MYMLYCDGFKILDNPVTLTTMRILLGYKHLDESCFIPNGRFEYKGFLIRKV